MSDFSDINNILPAVLYKKLKKQLEPITEKLDYLEYTTHMIESTPGPKGDKGDKGIKGDKGDQGPIGEIGPRGEVGPKGEQGIPGIQGPQGEKGEQGIQGEKGEQGIQGEVGPQGLEGPRGEQGPQGVQGEVGPKGDIGPQGIPGIQGPQGEQGIQGPQGIPGIQGPKGDIGPQGEKGEQGIPGPQGEKGEQGIQGPQGEQGPQGPEGPAGKDAIIPDINDVVEPFISKAQTTIDTYIDRSERNFKSWQTTINNQLTTISSGGEVWLNRLNDVQRSTATIDGTSLTYDVNQKKWVGIAHLPLTGGTISGDLTVEGDVFFKGNVTQIDIEDVNSEQWNVTNNGTGPAVTINQLGDQPIIDIQDDGSSVFTINDGGNITINGDVSINGSIDPIDSIQFNTNYVYGGEANGTLFYNSDKESLQFNTGNVNLNIGEEVYYPKETYNNTTETILNGTPVMLVGISDGSKYIEPAIADNTIDPANYLGITTEDIPPGSFGRVTYFGQVNDVETYAWSNGQYISAPVGSILYVDPTNAGQYTIDFPSSPNYPIIAGRVTKASTPGQSNGVIFVRYEVHDRAFEVNYNNTESELLASNVQAAIDELQFRKADISLLNSNITLFATTADSDILGYKKLVTTVDDPSYNTIPVNVSTGIITGNNQLVGALIAEPGLWVGALPYINAATIGNIAKVSGNSNNYCGFYFKIFKRSSTGIETEVAVSASTGIINPDDSTYREFTETALLDNTWLSTDRIVIKYYTTQSSIVGGDLIYNFEFGGSAPVRTQVPVPVSVIPSGDASDILVDTTNFGGIILSNADDTVQLALDTLDNHNHDSYYVGLQGDQNVNGIKNFDQRPTVNGTGVLLIGEGGGGGSVWTQSGTDIYYNDGNVGIGTSTPIATLEVNGTAIIQDDVTFNGIENTIPNQTFESDDAIITKGYAIRHYGDNLPVIDDTLDVLTEQFEDFDRGIDPTSTGFNIFSASAYGSYSSGPTHLFGGYMSTPPGGWQGNDKYTSHGVLLFRGPTASNQAFYAYLPRNIASVIDIATPGSKYETIYRMLIPSSTWNTENNGFFKIGPVQIGGTGPGDAGLNGGLMYNPAATNSQNLFWAVRNDDTSKNVAITSITSTSTTLTVTTASPHNLTVANSSTSTLNLTTGVLIAGTSIASYNTRFNIATIPSATTFTIASTLNLGTATGGTVCPSTAVIPFLFRRTSDGMGLVDTGFNFSTLINKWFNINYIQGFDTGTGNWIQAIITRDNTVLYDSGKLVITTAFSAFPFSTQFYSSGASRKIGIKFGNHIYNSRMEFYIDYIREKHTCPAYTPPSNWNSLRF